MLFTKLKLNHFGRFHGIEIDLKPGINLIYGENEAGKSTIHTFIKGMLFGIERMRGRGAASKEDQYTRYLPWDYPGAFSGQMDITVGDVSYRLQRSFHANDKNFSVINLATGREVKLREDDISELLPGLSEATFKNTISIEQLKAQTDTELAEQVRNYITNLSVAKSKEVNVAEALSSLTEQRKTLEAAQGIALLKSLQAEIEEGMEREVKIDTLSVELQNLLLKEQELKQLKDVKNSNFYKEEINRIEQLPAILEKNNTYQELTRQCHLLEKQSMELKSKVTIWEAELQSFDILKSVVTEAEKLDSEIQDYELRQTVLKKEKEENLRSVRRRNLRISIIATSLISFFSLLFFESLAMGAAISFGTMLAGVLCYFLLKKTNQWKQKQFKDKISVFEQQMATAKERCTEIFQRFEAATMEELSHKKEEILKHYYVIEQTREQLNDVEKRKRDTDDSRDVLYDSFMKYIQYFIQEETFTDTSMERLQEEILRRKQEFAQKQAETSSQYDACKLRIEKLKWDISTLEGNEEQLLANKEKYAELEQKHKDNELEIEAIKRAFSTIQELSIDIHDTFGRQLNEAVSNIIGEITNQKYTDIKVNEKLEVKVGWKGDFFLLDRLSAGTIDQIYFALRLAVADLLLGEDEMPLLLDDSFAFYDENRVKAALEQIAGRKQILLFSCHKREQELLKELKIPYHFVDLSE